MRLFAVSAVYTEGDGREVAYEAQRVHAVLADTSIEAEYKVRQATGDKIVKSEQVLPNLPQINLLQLFGVRVF